MPTHILGPEDVVGNWLVELLKRNADCLWAVAYLKAAALKKGIEAALVARVPRERFRLRIVFQDYGFGTEPEALDLLRTIGKRRSGSIELRWSRTEAFHAKGYAFRQSAKALPQVIVGSANLTAKAIGADSGELGVRLAPTKLSADAWDVMEAFFDDAKVVTNPWLEEYRTAYAAHQKASAAAQKL